MEILIFLFGAACGAGGLYFLFRYSHETASKKVKEAERKLEGYDSGMAYVTDWSDRFKKWAVEINRRPTDEEKKAYFKEEVEPHVPREYTFVRNGRGFRKVLLDNDGEPLFDQEYKE